MKMEHLSSGLSRYDEGTGAFTNNKGNEEGHVGKNGYVYLSLDGKLVLAHRLVFFLENGEWPEEDVDHINGIRWDNRRANLRLVSRKQNLMNRFPNKDRDLQVKNVYKHKSGRYRVKMKIEGKTKHFGYYSDLEEAKKVAMQAQQKYHGEYARNL